jgi:hypothetical protein
VCYWGDPTTLYRSILDAPLFTQLLKACIMSTIGKNNNIGSTHGKHINKVKCLYVRVQKLYYLIQSDKK